MDTVDARLYSFPLDSFLVLPISFQDLSIKRHSAIGAGDFSYTCTVARHLSYAMHVSKKCHIVVSQPTWVSGIMPVNSNSDLHNARLSRAWSLPGQGHSWDKVTLGAGSLLG